MTGAGPVTDGLADLTFLDETTLVCLQDLLVSVVDEVPGVQACLMTLTNSLGEAVLSSADVGDSETVLEASPSHPLVIDGKPAGALTFLQVPPAPSVDPALIAHATGRVAGFLAAAVTLAERDREITQLTQALESRTVIGQAAGLLMAQSNCRADTATEALKRQSQHSNIKLRDVAVALVQAHEVRITEAAAASKTRPQPPVPELPGDAGVDRAPATATRPAAPPAAALSAEPESLPDPERHHAVGAGPHPEGESSQTQTQTPVTVKSRKAAAPDRVLVLHQGGPHAGRLRRLSAAAARQALVYDRDLAVYYPATPPQQVQTREGPAQLWICH